MTTDEIKLLNLAVLQPNPFQPRNIVDDIELSELADSIKTYGILEPIVVAHTPAGYQIIAGERRWRAAKLLGLTEIPVVIKKTTPKGMLEMALIENVQRTNLNSLERAKAFQQLLHDFHLSTDELAKRIGKSASYISNSLRLLQLPDAIKDGLMSKQISEGHARAILGLKEKKLMIEIYKRILKENASVRRTEELVRNYSQVENSSNTDDNNSSFSVDPKVLKQWQTSFERILAHSKPKVKLSRSTKQTRLTITLKGNLEDTELDLQNILNLVNQR